MAHAQGFTVSLSRFCFIAFGPNFFYLLHFSLATLVADIFYQLHVGSHAPVFFASDISSNWVENVPSMNRVQYWFLSVFPERMEIYLLDLGTVGIKIMGFFLNLSKIEEWWLLGYGFGSFQRPSQIMSNSIQYDDPGIIQLIFLESGFVAGFLLVFILIRASLLSLKYESLRYYSVGITAWSLFALSSWEVWPLLLVMIFVFKIFSYEQMQRNSTAAKHRSPH